MRKIPTLYLRDPETNFRYLTRTPHPDCSWVFVREGEPTRKYDGTCTMFDGEHWWARREVKPGKATPPRFVALQTDDETGKTVGWEPIEQSAFAKYHAEALAWEYGLLDTYRHSQQPVANATYELIGPKVNGNPERSDHHLLVRHGYQAAVEQRETQHLRLDHDSLGEWLKAHDWEGIVWHHPDGRMAKIKRKDFP